MLVVNIIYCDLPCVKAISEETDDIDTHNIYVNKNLPHDKMKAEIRHELSHISMMISFWIVMLIWLRKW